MDGEEGKKSRTLQDGEEEFLIPPLLSSKNGLAHRETSPQNAQNMPSPVINGPFNFDQFHGTRHVQKNLTPGQGPCVFRRAVVA